MSRKSEGGWFRRFLQSEKQYPVVTGLAAGLYPLFFYYNNNYSLVNSWEHLGYFILMFLLLPIGVILVGGRISGLGFLKRFKPYALPFLNVFIFLFLLKVCLYAGLQKKMILGIIVIAGLFAWFLHKQLKKLVVIQIILAFIALVGLVPNVINQLNYSTEWMQQADHIESVEFKHKPNIYFLQPDGYVNFSEQIRGDYRLEETPLKPYLEENGFSNYDDFRTNYASTLSSNSSIFMMKHHYYNRGTSFNEGLNLREVVITDNSVLRALKKNGYVTHFLSEKPYLLMSRPKMGFDKSNFSYDDVPYITTGLYASAEILGPVKQFINETDEPKFFFIEVFNPGHIHNASRGSEGAEGERKKWLEKLKAADEQLKELIDLIITEDPGAMIVMMGDHGGFVGYNYTQEIYSKTQDRDKVHSIFSSQLSVRWPQQVTERNETKLKTSVNVFRIIFAGLSGDMSLIENLQADDSYVILQEGAPRGVYKYIDGTGEIVCEKH